jgi:hypothetical protein
MPFYLKPVSSIAYRLLPERHILIAGFRYRQVSE